MWRLAMRDGDGRMREDRRGRGSMAWRVHVNAGVEVAARIASWV